MVLTFRDLSKFSSVNTAILVSGLGLNAATNGWEAIQTVRKEQVTFYFGNIAFRFEQS